MTAEFRLAGEVIRGTATAAFFTRLGWVRRQCRQQLGFDPYPGTLNVRVFKEHLAALGCLEGQPGIELVPPTDEFCSSRALPVNIGAIVGALILPEQAVRVHGQAIVELIAPVRIKDALGITDGDTVEITFRIQDDGC